MVVTYTLASWARSFCTAAAFKQASGLQQKMAASDQTYGHFRPDMPNVRSKSKIGVSNYRLACVSNYRSWLACHFQGPYTPRLQNATQRPGRLANRTDGLATASRPIMTSTSRSPRGSMSTSKLGLIAYFDKL